MKVLLKVIRRSLRGLPSPVAVVFGAGATLAACARSLRRGGAAAVYGLTLFSTHRSLDEQLDANLRQPAP
jgi:hypothetical protein